MTSRMTRRQTLAGLTTLPFLNACNPAKQAFDADIIILGAGLSGLYAAGLLAEAGKDALVLEGSNRIGGRLHTIRHNGLISEGGGEQVGANYARILDTANSLNIALRPDRPGRQPVSYFHNGYLIGPEQWQEYPDHPLPPPFKGAHPSSPLFALAGQNNPLQSAESWRDPEFRKYDISAAEFLENAGLDPIARDAVDRALNANDLSTYSVMNVYRSLYLFGQSRRMGPSSHFDKGAQALPEAMAKALPRAVKLYQKISQIEVRDSDVLIHTQSGRSFRAQHCLCALPFGALRRIEISAPLGDNQKSAINNLPYTQILQVHFEANIPFWEIDGLPPDMWTDLPMERLFAGRDEKGEPNGLFRMWINGTGASALKGQNNQAIEDAASYWLKTARPASDGKINVFAVQRWTEDNPMAGGAYMHWAPGQISHWADQMDRPAGRLSFCGEHLSHLHTGMEGAMESAERAALGLLDI